MLRAHKAHRLVNNKLRESLVGPEVVAFRAPSDTIFPADTPETGPYGGKSHLWSL